jgi:hypothetical protein
MKAIAADTSFKFFPRLNDQEDKGWHKSGARFRPSYYEAHFDGDSLQSKLLKEIAYAHLLPVKEVLESFEYFSRIRRKVKAEVMCDLCCGHGLVGILFAVFEKKVSKVFLVDQREPASRKKLIKACIKVAPWIEAKIVNIEGKISPESEWLEEGMSVVGTHACGVLTDLCIDIGIKVSGNVAVMPCCYPENKCQAPMSLQANLGFETAFDIDRTYKLEKAGYHVNWHSIPASITPMNRVIIGKFRAAIKQ